MAGARGARGAMAGVDGAALVAASVRAVVEAKAPRRTVAAVALAALSVALRAAEPRLEPPAGAGGAEAGREVRGRDSGAAAEAKGGTAQASPPAPAGGASGSACGGWGCR
ncbi:unnamed protein product [Prorocentrum cordatum]|uniref:Uncharacterized protein n=1 Tax=Prorocentrum cordatum TaxID=2364126 RepID=A0ABN9PGL9_9DINO|nr:unnamed protein product [Polarella glacialis]